MSADADSVDIAEVHDCFTVAEISLRGRWVLSGRRGSAPTERWAHCDRRRVARKYRGWLGRFWASMETGVKQAVEIWRQAKGLCGPYQVQKVPEIGLSANMGGDDRTAVVTIYRNCS